MTTLSEIKIENLKSFENNPFIFREDTAFDMLIDSISNLGVLTPIIVRSLDDGNYEIISGHRRAEACNRLGIETIPCIVKELTKDEATVILVDLNLQRDEVLPSEKAHAYKMKMDALKNQGARTDLTSTQPVSKLTTSLLCKLHISQIPLLSKLVRSGIFYFHSTWSEVCFLFPTTCREVGFENSVQLGQNYFFENFS